MSLKAEFVNIAVSSFRELNNDGLLSEIEMKACINAVLDANKVIWNIKNGTDHVREDERTMYDDPSAFQIKLISLSEWLMWRILLKDEYSRSNLNTCLNALTVADRMINERISNLEKAGTSTPVAQINDFGIKNGDVSTDEIRTVSGGIRMNRFESRVRGKRIRVVSGADIGSSASGVRITRLRKKKR